MAKETKKCSFCGRPPQQAGVLISGVEAHICSKCVEQAGAIVAEEKALLTKTSVPVLNLLKPFEIKQHLDQYVIGQSGCTNYSFSETFAQSLGQFTPINVVGQQQWNWHSLYGAMVSGYANATANVTENWLVSPAHNLATSSSATLSFDHALNYASNATDRMANHTVWVSDNYVDGLPNTATWTQMPIPNMPAGNNWTFINAGNISIPQNMLEQNVRVAFKYLSNINTAATWELKNFSLNAQCVTSSSNRQVATPESVVSVYGRNIRVLSSSEIPVRIYDISGRMLHFEKASAQFEYAVEHQGVYIVVCLDKVYKLLVQ